MPHNPTLTVLMTVYNGMPYLAQAVRSVLEQEDKNCIFLILNNGSSDGTRRFLEQESERRQGLWPRLTVIHLDRNIGRTGVLNHGLSLIRTRLTAILDADDLALPGRFSAQSAFLEANKDVVLLGSDIVYLDRGGNQCGADAFPPEHERLRDRLPLYNQFAHSACMFRTGAALDAGGYPQGYPYAQDLALWIAMLRAGGKAASLPLPLAGIRIHPGQATRDLSLLMVRREDNHRLAEAMLDIPGLSPAARQAARLRSAEALFRLGRKKQALAQAWQALRENPLGLAVNPLLWQRARMQLRKKLSPARSG